MQRFKLWQNAWKNEKRFLRPVNIELPNEWDVKMLSLLAVFCINWRWLLENWTNLVLTGHYSEVPFFS